MPTSIFSVEPIFLLEFFASIAFAVSGVLSALRKQMDIIGICVCGFLAAFGGGTLRDVLLDRRPFFWVDHDLTLIAVLAICVGCAFVISLPRLEKGQRWLQVPDAVGLGLFSASGAHLSWLMGQPPVVVVMMGVITATFGGVLRDLVCNEIPALFKDHRPYALCAAAGGVAYCLVATNSDSSWWALIACAITTIGLRVVVLILDLTLPPVSR
jgi:uncharacterized membrane protein YeiH